MRMSQKELDDLMARRGKIVVTEQVKPHKYRAQKVTIDGITFDSKGEAARWHELKLMEKAGEISHLRRQVQFELAPSVVIDGRKRPPLRFTADFAYFKKGTLALIVEDFKNPSTADEPAFKMRRHLLKSVHGIDLTIVMKK